MGLAHHVEGHVVVRRPRDPHRIELLDQDIGCTFEADDQGQFTGCLYRDGQGVIHYRRT